MAKELEVVTRKKLKHNHICPGVDCSDQTTFKITNRLKEDQCEYRNCENAANIEITLNSADDLYSFILVCFDHQEYAYEIYAERMKGGYDNSHEEMEAN